MRYLIILMLLVGCTTTYEINEKAADRIITILSSDEMQGRTVYSEGIDRAADFIAKEFNSIGLNQMDNVEFFKQTFEVKSTSTGNSSISINDELIPNSHYFIQLSADTISWSSHSKPELIFIDKEADFRKALREILNGQSDMIAIVARAHEKFFKRFASSFSHPKTNLESNSASANVVIILTDTEEISTIEIHAAKISEAKDLTNVVGIIEGKRADEMVLFSAHYDHLGVGPVVEGDSIYNGANDDASGVTAVIELARYFNSQAKPERTLVFVAFTAEEAGGFGSQYFSKQLDPDQIVAMINIEMIGKQSSKGLNSAWMTGWDKSDLSELLQKNLNKISFHLFEDPYPKQNLFYRSDNKTLARLGVPAHSFTTTQIDIDTDYHELSDEVETLDIVNLTLTINAIATGIQPIVDGLQTPSRIDLTELRD